MRDWRHAVYAWGLVLLAGVVSPCADRPNFLFFLVDDLGWSDLSCYGSTFDETPHLDAFAATGMRFTEAYAAAPVCSPTRASILTGRHPVHVNITDWLPGQDADRGAGRRFGHVHDRNELPLSEVTFAERLHDAGYATFFAGKWHLGGEGFLPTEQGFDVNVGGNSLGSPPGGYYGPWKNPTLQANFEGEYLTERLTSESLQFLTQRDPQQPFLLYLSYYNVHAPITAYRKQYPHFQQKEAALATPSPTRPEHLGTSRLRQDNAAYASMVAAVDDSVGAILAQLETLGLHENTVIIFFSDNGGLSTLQNPGPTSNLPLRAGKGWLYEGGIRVPLIVRVPGITKPGSVCDSPVVSMDFFPTILELAQVTQHTESPLDGASLIAALEDRAPNDARTLVWHYPHYHGSTWTPGAAIRVGDWKLIEFYEWDDVELYDLASDPGEANDLSAVRPEQREALRDQLRQWQAAHHAQMPPPR